MDKSLRLVCLWGSVFFVSTALMAAQPSGRYKNVVDKMQELQKKYDNISSLFSLGENDDGVEIIAMRISLTPKVIDPNKIGQLVVATHHGNELAAADMATHFIEQMLQKFGSQELFRGNLATTEWTIVPVLNISGYNEAVREEHGVDPNRDYPGPCISATGGQLKSIHLMMDLLKTRIFTGSVTIHGYAGALTYPWGVSTTDTHTHDQNLYLQIVQKAAKVNGYRSGTSTDVVYPCDGAFEDYVYWRYGIWSLLVELETDTANDVALSSDAIVTYFDQLESSPSSHHDMTGTCTSAKHLDLHNE